MIRERTRRDAITWSIRQAWPQRYGNNSLRKFIRDCVKDMRALPKENAA